ncbi:hypothetical protein PR003_g31173 [Phytophthora rubi]|uniref:RxLR effector protein n=1 Tax=Phytophthora rubi TaxID=129364 RepID=A0A6A4BAZ8_9STRA|nr:hypothetical protein PR003_g31173 [Phytophthora rubi]
MCPCDPFLVVLLALSFACRRPPSSPSVARPFRLPRLDVASLKCLPVRHWWGGLSTRSDSFVAPVQRLERPRSILLRRVVVGSRNGEVVNNEVY